MTAGGRDTSGDLLADRRYAWGQACAREGDHAGAADLFAQAVALAPHWAPGWFALGEARVATDKSAAFEAFARCLACDPRDALGAGIRLAALGGATPARAPDAYVAALFDEYAPRFDAHLVEALGYRAPALLSAALERAAPARTFARALDLGCGTGLAARALHDRVARFEGVDLSAAMLARAEATGLYADLAQADILSFTAAREAASADLVVAADVFVYVGDLAPILAAIARALLVGGLCAFTVERAEGCGWLIGAGLRYAHSRGYVEETARAAGLTVLSLEEASTRRDAGADAPGLIVVLSRA